MADEQKDLADMIRGRVHSGKLRAWQILMEMESKVARYMEENETVCPKCEKPSCPGNCHEENVLDLSEAFRIAVEVHGRQRDKAGDPYLFHVMRVAQQMDTDEERVVAILHDVLEDTPGTFMSDDGRYRPTPKTQTLYRIRDFYGNDVSRAVFDLTRDASEPYLDYIRRLSGNPLAVNVKLADLIDNMDEYRLEQLPPEEADRLRKKYTEAFAILVHTLPEDPRRITR